MGKFCTNCGQELNNDVRFCLNCGESIKKEETKVDETSVTNTKVNNGQKSKIAASLLGIFLGSLGVHNFYLGFNGKAVAQLLITLLSCGSLSIVSSVWGLVEGILILTGSINVDAYGNPLGE